MDILEHLGMLVPDIEGHGVITGRANTTAALKMTSSVVQCSFVHINSDCTVHTQVVETTVVHTKLLHTTGHQ